MANTAKDQTTVAGKIARTKAAKPAKEKQRAVAFRNWRIVDENGDVKHYGSKGDSIFDNEYMSKEDRKFVEMAKARGGEVTINHVQFVIRLNKEQTELSDDLFDIVEKED